MVKSKKIQFKIKLDPLSSVEHQIIEGGFVDGPSLSEAIRSRGNDPLSETVLNYTCDFLDGKIKPPRGRKPVKKLALIQTPWVQQMLYQDILKRARTRKRRSRGFTALGIHRRENLCYDMPANELAARLVARKTGTGDDGWRSLQNLLSSQKQK